VCQLRCAVWERPATWQGAPASGPILVLHSRWGPLSFIFSIPALERLEMIPQWIWGRLIMRRQIPSSYDQGRFHRCVKLLIWLTLMHLLWVITTGEPVSHSLHTMMTSVFLEPNTYQHMLFSRISRERLSYDYLRLLPG